MPRSPQSSSDSSGRPQTPLKASTTSKKQTKTKDKYKNKTTKDKMTKKKMTKKKTTKKKTTKEKNKSDDNTKSDKTTKPPDAATPATVEEQVRERPENTPLVSQLGAYLDAAGGPLAHYTPSDLLRKTPSLDMFASTYMREVTECLSKRLPGALVSGDTFPLVCMASTAPGTHTDPLQSAVLAHALLFGLRGVRPPLLWVRDASPGQEHVPCVNRMGYIPANWTPVDLVSLLRLPVLISWSVPHVIHLGRIAPVGGHTACETMAYAAVDEQLWNIAHQCRTTARPITKSPLVRQCLQWFYQTARQMQPPDSPILSYTAFVPLCQCEDRGGGSGGGGGGGSGGGGGGCGPGGDVWVSCLQALLYALVPTFKVLDNVTDTIAAFVRSLSPPWASAGVIVGGLANLPAAPHEHLMRTVHNFRTWDSGMVLCAYQASRETEPLVSGLINRGVLSPHRVSVYALQVDINVRQTIEYTHARAHGTTRRRPDAKYMYIRSDTNVVFTDNSHQEHAARHYLQPSVVYVGRSAITTSPSIATQMARIPRGKPMQVEMDIGEHSETGADAAVWQERLLGYYAPVQKYTNIMYFLCCLLSHKKTPAAYFATMDKNFYQDHQYEIHAHEHVAMVLNRRYIRSNDALCHGLHASSVCPGNTTEEQKMILLRTMMAQIGHYDLALGRGAWYVTTHRLFFQERAEMGVEWWIYDGVGRKGLPYTTQSPQYDDEVTLLQCTDFERGDVAWPMDLRTDRTVTPFAYALASTSTSTSTIPVGNFHNTNNINNIKSYSQQIQDAIQNLLAPDSAVPPEVFKHPEELLQSARAFAHEPRHWSWCSPLTIHTAICILFRHQRLYKRCTIVPFWHVTIPKTIASLQSLLGLQSHGQSTVRLLLITDQSLVVVQASTKPSTSNDQFKHICTRSLIPLNTDKSHNEPVLSPSITHIKSLTTTCMARLIVNACYMCVFI